MSGAKLESDKTSAARAAEDSDSGRSRAEARLDVARWTSRLGVLTGVALALRAWWRNPSFIIDEALLGLNLRERSWIELGQPLDHMQAASPGFLFAQRALMDLFGDDDRILRLLPALALVGAFLMLPRWLERAAGPLGVALGTWVCATCYPIFVTAATAKPYTIEVAAAVLVPVAWFAALEGDRAARWSTAAATSVLLFFGLGVWIVVAGTAAGLAAERESRRRLFSAVWRWPALVVVASAALALVAMRSAVSAATVEYMRFFWRAAFVSDSWLEWGEGWVRILALELLGLRGRFAAAVAAAAILGGWLLAVRERRPAGAVSLGVAALAAAATALAAYPVVVRLSHFLLPTVAAGFAALLAPLDRRIARRPALASLAALAVLAGGVARATTLDPERGRERPRQLLAALLEKVEPGDRIYVRYGAVPAWRWYVPAAPVPRATLRLGECWRHAPGQYASELAWLRGAPRAWVVYSHSSGKLDHELVVHRALSAAGRELDRVAAGADGIERLEDVAWLYDFRDVERFDAAVEALDFDGRSPESPLSCSPWATVARVD